MTNPLMHISWMLTLTLYFKYQAIIYWITLFLSKDIISNLSVPFKY